jgi:hypothetical protein
MRAAVICALAAAAGCTLDLSQKHDCRDDADCLGGRVCRAGVCGSPDAAAESPNTVFVTSGAVPLALASLDAADQVCAAAATAAQLAGHYRAWLSTSTADARDRLQGARGWVRPDGAPFADTVEDIAAGRIFNPPLLDEHGAAATSAVVVTGTAVDGRGDPAMDCGDWSGAATGMAIAGTTAGTTGVWTYFTTVPCNQPARLYCFGVDHVATVAPPPARGKLAFLSEGPFTVGGGLAAADAQCAREAAAAGLNGTFRALLSAPGASAASRVQANAGAVWLRLDGVALDAEGSSAFLDASTMLAPLNVTSQRRYMDANVFTGAAAPDVPGNDAQTCDGWAGGAGAGVGRANYVPWWFASGDLQPCTSSAADIYCFQSN